MTSYRSIVISGPVAAGNSTAASAVAEKLKLEYRSAGDFFRQYALKHNIPLYAKEEIPDDLDKKIDQELTDLTDSEKGVIIDAHYAGYFNRNKDHVLKVLLTCYWQERLKRAASRVHTHTETAEEIKKREKGLDLKFRKLYANENFLDRKFFDLVIDTTNTRSVQVVQKIINKFHS